MTRSNYGTREDALVATYIMVAGGLTVAMKHIQSGEVTEASTLAPVLALAKDTLEAYYDYLEEQGVFADVNVKEVSAKVQDRMRQNLKQGLQ